MYIAIGIIISLFSVIEMNKVIIKRIFFYLISMLTLMLCFRYGQGTDYYEYYIQYVGINPSHSLFVNALSHGEIGWYIIMLIFKKIGISYENFIIIISAIMMYCMYYSIKKYSPYRVVSLLLFYPTYYLTYCFSTIRQGLVICLFLSLGLKLLLELEYKKYFLLILILASIHKSCLILLILIVILKFDKYRLNKLILLSISLITIIILSYKSGMFLSLLGGYTGKSISYYALLIRTYLFITIYLFYIRSDNGNSLVRKMFLIYLTGFVIYLSLSLFATLSQRLTIYFKSIEIFLLPILISKNEINSLKIKKQMMTLRIGQVKIFFSVIIIIVILNFELYKNIDSYIYQGNYYNWVNPFNYPYSSIFDKSYIRNYVLYFDGEEY